MRCLVLLALFLLSANAAAADERWVVSANGAGAWGYDKGGIQPGSQPAGRKTFVAEYSASPEYLSMDEGEWSFRIQEVDFDCKGNRHVVRRAAYHGADGKPLEVQPPEGLPEWEASDSGDFWYQLRAAVCDGEPLMQEAEVGRRDRLIPGLRKAYEDYQRLVQ